MWEIYTTFDERTLEEEISKKVALLLMGKGKAIEKGIVRVLRPLSWV